MKERQKEKEKERRERTRLKLHKCISSPARNKIEDRAIAFDNLTNPIASIAFHNNGKKATSFLLFFYAVDNNASFFFELSCMNKKGPLACKLKYERCWAHLIPIQEGRKKSWRDNTC